MHSKARNNVTSQNRQKKSDDHLCIVEGKLLLFNIDIDPLFGHVV